MEIIESIPQLEGLRHEWNRLADLTGQAVLRHEWFLCAARAFHNDAKLAVVILRRGQRLSAVAPLVHHGLNGVERLEFIGAAALHEPSGFLYEDEAAHAELIQELFRLNQPLVLHRVPPLSVSAMTECPGQTRRGWLITRATASSLGLRLTAGDGFMTALPGKLRYDIKRARTRATAKGHITFDIVKPSVSDVDSLFEQFVAVEASGWKGRQQSALASRSALHFFFKCYAQAAAALRILRFFLLRIGNTTVAGQLAVEVYDRLWILKIGYDETFAHCSPGLLSTSLAIEYALKRGLRSYEFLGSAESWEERWRPESREHRVLIFYPRTLKGCVVASVDMAHAAWRSLRSPAMSVEFAAVTSSSS